MAPPKTTKQPEVNPWGWTSEVRPEDIQSVQMHAAYRITGYQGCSEPRRQCKRNPYCLWGLGEKKWRDENEGEDDQDGAAFRCEGEYAGLQNLGATCYVNSLLQLWFHNPIFRPAILKWTPANDKIIHEGDYKPHCPLAQLQAIFARLKLSKRSKIDPTDFVSSLLLNTGEQQDAQEFAKLFMDYIVKLLTDYGDGQIRKLIDRSFNGHQQYETECLGCKNSTRRPEEFTELNLSVKKHLSESLDELLADETISDYMCSNCEKKNTAKRRLQLKTLPPILNLQLLRFVYDREANRRKKVTQNISFPEVLDMRHRISGINTDECDPALYKYHLTAVLIHNGQSASSGHYVAQIKDLRNGEWLKFNDEFVDPVSKGRSQKSKDDDSDESERKKQKKSKNSPSLTSSGAYMLVYTLDHFIQNPEPDPELHPYLVDLVKREDASFEIEVNKNKSEKDFEQAVRNQRRKEVEWLYELQKQAPHDNGKADSDSENVEGPKPKIPRYDDTAISMEMDTEESSKKVDSNEDEGPCDLTTTSNGHNGENHTSSNGIGNGVSTLPERKKLYDLDEIDFVSTDWINQWLDPGNPVPPVENTMLLCEHKKLAPPSPNINSCLYRIVPSPLANVWYEHYQGGPRLKCQDLCEICVHSQCRRLRALAELEEDSKRVSELVKKWESDTSIFLKTNQNIPDALLENKVWISKESLRTWKRLAKRSIEGPSKDKEIEVVGSSEDCLEADGPFNADLFCEHGTLSPDENSRKIIPAVAWKIIEKYFINPVALEVLGTSRCEDCLYQEEATTLALQKNKEIAAKQKAALSELYSNRNRPEFGKLGLGDVYMVSSAFVSEWRRFVKEPTRYDIVKEVNNQTLMCQHDKFMYPMSISEIPGFSDDSDEIRICLITPEEWKFVQQNFHCDQEIKAEVNSLDNKEAIIYEPEMCTECADNWVSEVFKKQYEYADSLIYIKKREKGDTVESEEEEDPQKEKDQVIVTGKREVKKMDPDAWMTGFASTNNSTRRSSRPRNSKGEKSYKVSSTTTIKELKSKICQDFKALLSDQHLFYNGAELSDLQKTLSEYRIPIRAKIHLEIDTADNGSAEEPASAVETGFQGTLLISGNAFGDTRSPVQN